MSQPTGQLPTEAKRIPTRQSTTKRITETQLKQRIYAVLDKHFPGHYRKKFSGQFIAGCLDLIIIYQGRSIWFELKCYPNKLTPLQIKEMLLIQAAGGTAYCLTYGHEYYYIGSKQYTDLLTLLKEVLQ